MEQQGFDRLLAALDPDRDRAGQRYEALRARLARVFSWRGAPEPDRCADETLDRVARRLAEGASVPDVAAYCHGVAQNVLREQWRRPDRALAPLESVPVPAAREPDAVQAQDALHHEHRLECLDGCLARLEPSARALLVRYHATGPGSAPARRRALAAELGVPLNALRIRTHRLRAGLAACIQSCLGHREGRTR